MLKKIFPIQLIITHIQKHLIVTKIYKNNFESEKNASIFIKATQNQQSQT